MVHYRKTMKKFIMVVLMGGMMASLAACNGNDNNSHSESSPNSSKETKETNATKEPVELTLLVTFDAAASNRKWGFPNSIFEEITKKTGVKLNVVGADDQKYKVLMASGDLPDIIMAKPDNFKQLIQGGLVVPMDDLLKTNGKDIVANKPLTMNFSKKYFSNGTDKTYFVSAKAGKEVMGFDGGQNFVTRWDYYKELGYPTVKNEDDMLNVLAEMLKKHPTTEDGKKVYGISAFNDWGVQWGYAFPMALNMGYTFTNTGNNNYMQQVDTNEITSTYSDTNGPLWKDIAFLYKANKMGMLDPDAFINKFDDFEGKISNGTVLYTPQNWIGAPKFNAIHSKDGVGFENIPMEGQYIWTNRSNPIGWVDKSLAISKSSKHPDRAMDLINFFNSYEGSRLLASGVEGKDWTVTNGKAELTDEVAALINDPDGLLAKTGLGPMGNLEGIGDNEIDPKDNSPINLFNTPKVYKLNLDTLSKDYSAHYGATYPAEVFTKLIKDGKIKDHSKLNTLISSALELRSDDIKRIDTKLDDIMTKGVPMVVLSKSDAEFEANKQKLLDDLKKAGIDTSIQWWMQAWAKAKADVEALNK